MKTLVICGIITLIIIFVIVIITRKENYNAIPPIWKWNSLENDFTYPEKCIAKPGKFFQRS